MKRLQKEEMFPVVDDEGNTLSIASRKVCHNGKSMLLHPVVHFHLFNSKGELYLQKRAMTKDLLPGKWDTSVGGHISPGESIEEALKREAEEELGLEITEYDFCRKYIWESSRERELVYTFTGTSEAKPVVNHDELDDGRFHTIKEIKDKIGKDIFTPNFEYEFLSIIYRDIS